MIKKFPLISATISLILGFCVASLIFIFKDDITISKDNIINITGIIINLITVIIIGFYIQKRFLDSREVKNLLVQEIKDLHLEFKNFSTSLSSESMESQNVLNWYKLYGIKLNHLNYFLKTEFKINCQDLISKIQDHRTLVTKSQSFNDSFASGKTKLDAITKTKVINSNKEYGHCFLNLIIKVTKN